MLQKSANMLALTSTTTKTTMEFVTERLSMRTPEIVGLPLNRKNIKYIVNQEVTTKTFIVIWQVS